jgi:hypothetical protein
MTLLWVVDRRSPFSFYSVCSHGRQDFFVMLGVHEVLLFFFQGQTPTGLVEWA